MTWLSLLLWVRPIEIQVVSLLAAGDPSSTVDLSVFGQYGVLGVFVVLMLFVIRTMYQREVARADKAEAEVLRLNGLIQEKVIPALVQSNVAQTEQNALLRQLLDKS